MNRYLLPMLLVILLCATKGWSQKKLLTPSDKVTKIAYLDHSALRKGYIAYKEAQENFAREFKSDKQSLDSALHNLDEQTKTSLKRDSLRGGANRQTISSQADSKRAALTTSFRESQQKKIKERTVLIQEYEKKIMAAIEAVVNEGGFTDVKPAGTATDTSQRGNITSLVLQKLN